MSNGELRLAHYSTIYLATVRNYILNATLPLNRTYLGYMIVLAPWVPNVTNPTFNNPLGVNTNVLVPCRVDVIYIPNPQLALNVSIPYPELVESYFGYWHIGELSPSGDPYAGSFGHWIWGINATPINITW